MKRKIPTLIICDIFLAMILFAKVNIRSSILSSLDDKMATADVNFALCGNNWITICAMTLVGVIMGVVVLSKNKSISDLITDFALFGVPGVILAVWWRVLAYTGWGYFISYQEMMAYIGSLMIGVCVIKLFMYIFKKAD